MVTGCSSFHDGEYLLGKSALATLPLGHGIECHIMASCGFLSAQLLLFFLFIKGVVSRHGLCPGSQLDHGAYEINNTQSSNKILTHFDATQKKNKPCAEQQYSPQ